MYELTQRDKDQILMRMRKAFLVITEAEETLVFFIRQKDKPKDSFITAEYRKGSITQLYYKNNRAVTEKHLKQIARDFAHNLKTASFEARRI